MTLPPAKKQSSYTNKIFASDYLSLLIKRLRLARIKDEKHHRPLHSLATPRQASKYLNQKGTLYSLERRLRK